MNIEDILKKRISPKKYSDDKEKDLQNSIYEDSWSQKINQLQQEMNEKINQQMSSYKNPLSTPAAQATYYGGASIIGGMSNWGNTLQNMEEEDPTPAVNTQGKDITIDEAKEIVLRILNTNIVPFLWGPPGVGKSTLVKQICKEKGWDLIDLRLSLLNPVDLRGLPVVDKARKLAEWLPPSFLPNGHTPNAGILFLDEINLAPLSVQAAAYQLILDKKVGEYKLPSHWKIVAAGNRETDKANVYKMSAPLANRFIHLTVRPDFQTWKKWAAGQVRKEIISFLLYQPTLLFKMPNDSQKAFPSPRTWQFLSEVMDVFGYIPESDVDDNLAEAIRGTIGPATGTQFIKFLKDYKIKAASKMLADFIDTGKLKIPADTSLHFAFMTAAFDAYHSGKLSSELYEKMKKGVSAEHREILKAMDDRVKVKPATLTEVETTLFLSSKRTDDSIVLTSVEGLPSTGYIRIGDDLSHEDILYRSVALTTHSITGVVRGTLGTKATTWMAGTKATLISNAHVGMAAMDNV